MIILGLSCGHDAAAALVVDGELVADAQEERFRRIKHIGGFPMRAIDYCLRHANIDISAVNNVAIAASGPARTTDIFLGLDGKSNLSRARHLAERLPLGFLRPSPMEPPISFLRLKLDPRCDVHYIDHHRAHAASAQFTSGWQDPYLLVTCDGIGDGTSLTISSVVDGRAQELSRLGAGASLGWFYGIVTEGLGWVHGDGEGKTMGLAPYGKPDRTRDELRKFCPEFRGGELVSPVAWKGPATWFDGGVSHSHFDEAAAVADLLSHHDRADLAAGAQALLEEEICQLVDHWLRKLGTRAVACSGGVFLNVKLNQRIWELPTVSAQHIFANCGDAGLAFGAAVAAHALETPGWSGTTLSSLYHGPEITPDQARHVLDTAAVSYRSDPDASAFAASAIADGQIVAWVQGRMESGPRALGNRSFLMSPTSSDHKRIMNERVKFREGFRPFCPSLLPEAFPTYMPQSRDEQFMVTSFDVDPTRAEDIAAVVHVDGTARPQAVHQESNPRYHALLTELRERTGVPAVLNTSLNVRGEPIVCDAIDALRCFASTGADHLVLGDLVVSKTRL